MPRVLGGGSQTNFHYVPVTDPEYVKKSVAGDLMV